MKVSYCNSLVREMACSCLLSNLSPHIFPGFHIVDSNQLHRELCMGPRVNAIAGGHQNEQYSSICGLDS